MSNQFSHSYCRVKEPAKVRFDLSDPEPRNRLKKKKKKPSSETRASEKIHPGSETRAKRLKGTSETNTFWP